MVYNQIPLEKTHHPTSSAKCSDLPHPTFVIERIPTSLLCVSKEMQEDVRWARQPRLRTQYKLVAEGTPKPGTAVKAVDIINYLFNDKPVPDYEKMSAKTLEFFNELKARILAKDPAGKNLQVLINFEHATVPKHVGMMATLVPALLHLPFVLRKKLPVVLKVRGLKKLLDKIREVKGLDSSEYNFVVSSKLFKMKEYHVEEEGWMEG